MMEHLDFFLERSVVIRAPREMVFRYFTDSERFAGWWGPGSRIDARPGGEVLIRYPNAVVARGEVVELLAPERIVFTYGYEGEGKPIPPGGSRVTIELREENGATRLRLRHDVPSAKVRDEHVQGWRYQLSLFANIVSREVNAKAEARVDAFFEAWGDPEEPGRRRRIESSTMEDVTFRDAFSCVSGREELLAHLAATRIHMPGMTIAREGEIRECQGTAIVHWIAKGPDGAVAGRGTNVFELSATGAIRGVTGFWGG
jgi:uncharacterized protein YndB with AHSA1/START domain